MSFRGFGRFGRGASFAGVVIAAVLLALPVTATAAPPAAFTTVNETVDGPDRCKNGNPAVNCNVYTGKEFVWLNGGPAAAALGDGSYFFAVLEPGGQADPNDGTAKNLSSGFDSYADRTFSVSGGTLSYTGTHDFDSNKIRLADYADTANPGGVYILAICELKGGTPYPVNPRNCKYDAFKVSDDDTPPPIGSDLTVTKDAAGAYKTTYSWTIDKSVDRTVVKQVGGSATFNYTVTVEHGTGVVSDVNVSGTITVFNPNVDSAGDTVPVSGVDVEDQLSDGTACAVTQGSDVTLTDTETTFAYSCSLQSLPAARLDNKVTVTWPTQSLDNGAFLGGDSADFTFVGEPPANAGIAFSETVVDDCVSVTDAFNGGAPAALAGGSVCVGDANPTALHYSRVIAVPAYGCAGYNNTAVFTTNTTGTTGSDGQAVTVCGPASTGALTIGFWKGPNGNSLISGYCAPPSGKTSLAAYLSRLGGGSGPFTGASGKACKDLVTYVNGIIGGASSTNMNTMLRAQMLATALDVYFTSPNLGWTTTAAGKIKPPSAFLPGTPLGAFAVDLTAVCPMVADTLTGTATCKNGTPSTDGFASGAFPAASLTVQALLDYLSTTPSPFSGTGTSPVWYAGDRVKQEIAKDVFDQINNQNAFAA
jgi:hypothetical protein